jgi:hypothetical protein
MRPRHHRDDTTRPQLLQSDQLLKERQTNYY